MEGNKVSVSFSGPTMEEVQSAARKFLGLDTGKTVETKRGRKPAQIEEPLELEPEGLDVDTNLVGADADLGLDDSNDVNFDAEPEPKKSAATTKLTAKDVNAAALAHAKKNTRAATMKVLAKFKVQSINDLKPAQYAEVVKALKV